MKHKLHTLKNAAFAAMLSTSCAIRSQAQAVSGSNSKEWWKEAVVYQVYPRSFKDSDGDGIGDLKGIISRLDYIKSLGIDVVWLNPIFSSPNDDNGYDISDYEGIMHEFGTMKDFDALLEGMHARKIKLVLDLVVNHSSDEHKWFRESRKSRTNPYRQYYHWWPAERGKPAPRASFFDVNGDAWKYDALTNAYYLHYFSVKQPDLNWENPILRKEIYKMMDFWFKKGVDGFRMDVIPFISKDTAFPVITKKELDEKYHGDWAYFYGHGPFVHQYLKEMNKEVLNKYDVMTVAEGAGTDVNDALLYVGKERKELNMLYHFEGVNLGYLPNEFKQMNPEGYELVEFKKIYSRWDSVFATNGWGTIYLGNHDQPRMLTRWGNDSPGYREASSKMLTTFLMSMRATPYYYSGDELGMDNIKFDNIKDYRDIETINYYRKLQNENGDTVRFLNGQKISARDNGRTPFQWDSSKNAGFTSGVPWLKVNPDYKEINVAVQEGDPNSVLNYFRKIVKLRKQNPVLIYGKYELLDQGNKKVYAFTRTLGSRKVLVLLNFTKETTNFNLSPAMGKLGEVMINNLAAATLLQSEVKLLPYQALIINLINGK
jgi:oligo-1,6-glucosidase